MSTICSFYSGWLFKHDDRSSLKFLVDALQRQVNSLTEQVATMSQSYEELIEGKGSMDG